MTSISCSDKNRAEHITQLYLSGVYCTERKLYICDVSQTTVLTYTCVITQENTCMSFEKAGGEKRGNIYVMNMKCVLIVFM